MDGLIPCVGVYLINYSIAFVFLCIWLDVWSDVYKSVACQDQVKSRSLDEISKIYMYRKDDWVLIILIIVCLPLGNEFSANRYSFLLLLFFYLER